MTFRIFKNQQRSNEKACSENSKAIHATLNDLLPMIIFVMKKRMSKQTDVTCLSVLGLKQEPISTTCNWREKQTVHPDSLQPTGRYRQLQRVSRHLQDAYFPPVCCSLFPHRLFGELTVSGLAT